MSSTENQAKEKMIAELVNDRLIVWNIEHSREIYKSGYYGKPIGVPKPKNFEFNAPLTLDLIEGLHLLRNGVIAIVKGNKKVGPAALERMAKKYHEGFEIKYKVYEDLRRRGYVVTPGIKFGCTYAVYEHGPGVDHAPFLVEVKEQNESVTAPDLVRAGRLATTVKKRFVFAIINRRTGSIDYLVSKWWKA